jgi:excisionase family DNA binding protein
MNNPSGFCKGKEDAMDSLNTDATLTVDEAHNFIGKKKISRGALYAAINRNEVPNLRLGHRILIPRHALMQWLESAGR